MHYLFKYVCSISYATGGSTGHIGKEKIQLFWLVKSNLALFQANDQEVMGKGRRENH